MGYFQCFTNLKIRKIRPNLESESKIYWNLIRISIPNLKISAISRISNLESESWYLHISNPNLEAESKNVARIRILRFGFGILTIIGESRILLRREAITLASHSKKFCPRQLRKAKRLKMYDPVSVMKTAPNICRLQICLSMCSFHGPTRWLSRFFQEVFFSDL